MRPPDLSFVDGLIDPAYLDSSAVATAYVRAHVARILARLDLWSRVVAPMTLDELANLLGIVPGARQAFAWLVGETVRDGRAVRDDSGRYMPIADRRPTDADWAAASAAVDAQAATIAASRAMFDYVASHYPEFLTGARSAPAILLRGDGLTRWESYFSAANPLYDVHNQAAALALRQIWPAAPTPLHVIEVGAGTGGASAAIANAIANLDAGAGSTFTITDIAPSLLVRALERLGDRRITARRRLDFDRPLAPQGFDAGSADVCVAVNTLHAARDPATAIAGLRAALSPGGCLVISESVCASDASVHQEFIFSLLPSERAGSRFLSGAEWRTLLRACAPGAALAVNSRPPELAMVAVVPAASPASSAPGPAPA